MCGASLQRHGIVWDEVLAMCAMIQLLKRTNQQTSRASHAVSSLTVSLDKGPNTVNSSRGLCF